MGKQNVTRTVKSRTRWHHTGRGAILICLVVGAVVASYSLSLRFHNTIQASSDPGPLTGQGYLYYVMKTPAGFVLARAHKGQNAQPTEMPQQVASFGGDFGLALTDNILSLQLSPDEHYLAIAGTRSDEEPLWIFDTQHLSLNLEPASVSGTFLHWLPGAHAAFLYRPMFPMGLEALQGQTSWSPGLWVVDAATGAHTNLDLHMPSAFLVDAAAGPDAKELIYSTSSGLNAGSAIWSMSTDGHNQTQLFSLPGGTQAIAGQFTWSPDGQTIAYERLADSSTPFLAAGLWLMNSHSGRQQYLTQADGGHGFALNWSPDGKELAFVARTNPATSQANQRAQALQSAVEVVNINTGHVQMVGGPEQTGMQMNTNPVWSADSSHLTFVAYNPLNPVVGGSPRYWSTQVNAGPVHPAAAPLSPSLAHVVAFS